MYDTESQFKIIWDNKGEMYILTDGICFFTEMNCNIKAFKYQALD